MTKALLLSLLFLTTSSKASIGKEMENWFKGQDYANTTSPRLIEGQGAGYLTLGGISTRAAVSHPQDLVSVQTPKFQAGCGGIDFYSGGFSAIDSDQLIKNLRAIGQNAKSLAFMLAIQVLSPQVSGLMQKIQTWANKFNEMNKGSCEAAMWAVGGTMEYFGEKEGNCTLKRMQDYGEDYTKANQNCTRKGQMRATEGDKPNSNSFVKGNLAWYVLMQDDYFKTDLSLAELIVNLTGTIIVKDQSSSGTGTSSFQILEAAISDNKKNDRFHHIYKSLLYGKALNRPLKIYTCLDKEAKELSCQTMSSKLKEMAVNWDGLYTKVKKQIDSIIVKIKSDTPLNSAEQGILSSTSIPLYRFLNVATAYFPNTIYAQRAARNYSNLIAEDILLRSLNSIISLALSSTNQLGAMSGTKRVIKYRQNLEQVLEGLAGLEKNNKRKTEDLFEMQRVLALYEKAMVSKLGTHMITKATWGGN